MRRGSAADFWRAVDVGLRLAELGWMPWTLLARRGDRAIDLNRFDCHAGIWTKRRARMHGVRSMAEFLSSDPPRRPRVKHPHVRRARFILEALAWLRTSNWSPKGVDFRLTRRGSGWTLTSDLYFFRREGLYWNHWLAGRRAEEVEPALKRAGFRVYPGDPHGVAFDQDFLPSRGMAAGLAALTGR